MIDKEYVVIVTGFTSKKAANTFVNWYSNSGEQDAGYVFDEECPECDPCSLDMSVQEID